MISTSINPRFNKVKFLQTKTLTIIWIFNFISFNFISLFRNYMSEQNSNQLSRFNKFLTIFLVVLVVVIVVLSYLLVLQNRNSDQKQDEINKLQNQINELKGQVSSTKYSSSSNSSSEASSQVSVSSTSSSKMIDVKVYFSKLPESQEDFTFTQSVNRQTNRMDIATFVIESLLDGPNTQEKTQGLFNPINISGNSDCFGKDFSLNLVNKKVTLRFCRDFLSNGIGDDARAKTVLTANLTQFSTITQVVILTKDGNCLGDLSGLNLCKN